MPLAGTQSIPAISKPQFGTKSLADRSCNLIRGFLGVLLLNYAVLFFHYSMLLRTGQGKSTWLEVSFDSASNQHWLYLQTMLK
jgi:hypothetical protein